MPTRDFAPPPTDAPPRPRLDATRVLRALEEYCETLQPGDRIPRHQELMKSLGASERAVRWALDELRREGRIIRRQKLGTFIAERNPEPGEPPGGSLAGAPPTTGNRRIVAITEPDRGVFDRAMSLLFRHAEEADLTLACQLVKGDTGGVSLLGYGSQRPLGCLVFGRQLLPLARELQDAGHRVVLVGTPYADALPGVPTVQGDQEQGGYLVTRHLLELGHRRIAFRGWSDWPRMQRYLGHQRAITEARRRGVVVEESAVYEEEYEQWRSRPELAEAYIRRPGAPTAIIAWNDPMAAALLSLLSYVGVRVPQDVSLVGYDNLPASEEVHPRLTTVDVALEHQLQAAVRLLTRPAPPAPAHTVVVLPTLVARQSTAPASE